MKIRGYNVSPTARRSPGQLQQRCGEKNPHDTGHQPQDHAEDGGAVDRLGDGLLIPGTVVPGGEIVGADGYAVEQRHQQKDNRGSGPYCCQRSAAGIAAYHYGIRRVIGQLQEAGEHQGD